MTRPGTNSVLLQKLKAASGIWRSRPVLEDALFSGAASSGAGV